MKKFPTLKGTLALLIILMAVGLLASCSQASNQGANSSTQSPAETTEAPSTTAPNPTEESVTEPTVETTDAPTVPETKPSENEGKPADKTDEPSSDTSNTDDTDEVLVTYYATREVTCRSGRGSSYKKVATLDKGDSVKVVKGSKKNGWYKVKIDDEYCYAYAEYLSKSAPSDDNTADNTTPSEPNSGSDSPTDKPSTSTNTTGVAKPSTGISWDGVSPIIYTYPDGTTGTTPKDGATYESVPGVTTVYKVPRDNAGREIGSICETCGKEVNEQSKGKYCAHFAKDSICEQCGEHVTANTCHTCKNYTAGVRYCRYCGKVSDDGSHGTCIRWSSKGEFTCPSCEATVPGKTCHTCEN